MKKTRDNSLTNVDAVTPIYAVHFVSKAGVKVLFANFYGTTVVYQKDLDKGKVDAKIQESNTQILKTIETLEEKINAGRFNRIKPNLVVEINLAQFDGFMQKIMLSKEDAFSCKTVEQAFELFNCKYSNLDKTEKRILNKKLKTFKKTLNAMDDF